MIGSHMIANFKPHALQIDYPCTIIWNFACVSTIDRRLLSAHWPHRLGSAKTTVAQECVHVSYGCEGGVICIIKNGESEIFAVWPLYPFIHHCFLLGLRGQQIAIIARIDSYVCPYAATYHKYYMGGSAVKEHPCHRAILPCSRRLQGA